MRLWTCLIILYVAAVAGNESDKPDWLEVRIVQGPVRGRRDSTGELFTFYNIPYATAPTDKNKFKAPLPPPTWTEPFDAIDKRVICPQYDLKPFMPEDLVKLENCLIANVFVPDTKEKNLSVLVYVHGGGFQVGYGDWLTAKKLMKYQDIIIVNFNYRLGVHGFLCLGTEDAPGNAGMKDQVALLRWVQQNIAAFGGNPNDVTISGSSAGSASVDLLMLSKSAKGLFHKVIPESGANLAPFAVQGDPLRNAKDHAKRLKFTNVDDIYALEEFYTTRPYETLIDNLFMNSTDATAMFAPCIERDTGDEPFLTEPPVSILRRGDYTKVPLLYGFANMEGLIFVNNFETMWKDRMNEKFSDFLPGNLKFETVDEKEEVAKQIKEFYFGEKPLSEDNILKFVDYYSDLMFVHSTLWAVRLHAAAGNDQVYLYVYSFVDEDTPVVPHTNVRGATHCAQTMAVFDGKNLTTTSEDDMSEELRNIKKICRELWHNFVKTGKPVPDGSSLPAWPAAGPDGSPHMSLGQKVELQGAISEKSTLFWNNIYEKYYSAPIPPPQPPPKPRVEL